MNKFSKLILLIIITLAGFTSCHQVNTNQINDLAQEEKVELREKLIRYIGRKPEDASNENKFEAFFDSHYENEQRGYDLEYYYKSNDGKVYFLFTRIAPSNILKKVGIAGFVKFNKTGKIIELEEVFRTWKQEPQKLKEVNNLLFTKMINGENLSPYYTENSNGVEYIEFPNKEVWYDKPTRTWKTSRFDPLEEFQQEKIKRTQQVIDEQKELSNKKPIVNK
jgi:hypothetical protein